MAAAADRARLHGVLPDRRWAAAGRWRLSGGRFLSSRISQNREVSPVNSGNSRIDVAQAVVDRAACSAIAPTDPVEGASGEMPFLGEATQIFGKVLHAGDFDG